MREQFMEDMKAAMKAGDKDKLATVRLIIAKLKEVDIEARGAGREPVSKDEIMAMLQKMIKQRAESADIYDKGGRPELAAQERRESEIISSYLPAQMNEAAILAAVAAAISETGAASIKDMGKVVGVLKGKHTGQMDFAKASALVKSMLAQG